MGTGRQIIDLGALDAFQDVAVQPDGKLIAVGSSRGANGDDFVVMRFNPNGSLDIDFGTAGTAVTSLTPSNDVANSVVLQPDGKIVAGGYATASPTSFALVRYNADGTLDTSFGGGTGKVITPVTGRVMTGEALALQPDGKLLLAGLYNVPGTIDLFGVARYNADGSLDTGFGSGGIAFANIGATGNQSQAFGIVVDGSGGIVLVGSARDQSSQNPSAVGFGVARFTSAGVLDTSFGGPGGIVTQVGAGVDLAYDIVRQLDGKLLVAGTASDSSSGSAPDDFALVRYNPNGTLDTSFGGTGKVRTGFGQNGNPSDSVALQPDGKIVVAGYVVESANGNTDFALARYNADGSLDAGFGAGGKVILGATTRDQANSVSIQADGKIVIVGMIGAVSDDFGIVRLNANGSLDLSFGGNVKDGNAAANTITAPDAGGWELNGRGGDDVLAGAAGPDVLNGNDGNDTITGGGGADLLTGGLGADIFRYTAASDSGSTSPDQIADFATGIDKISLAAIATTNIGVVQSGASSILFVSSAGGSMQINVAGTVQGSDLVTNGAGVVVQGDGASTTLLGSASNDTLFGNGGNDVLVGSLGADILFGGAGNDTFRFIAASESNAAGADLIADFTTGADKIDLSAAGATAIAIIDNGPNSIVFANTASGQIQIGSLGTVNGNDIIANVGITVQGGAASSQINGGNLSDTLFGEGGNDLLVGLGGGDVLFGGAGADSFRYLSASDSTAAAPDLIADFQTGIDKVDLTGTGMTAVGIANNIVFASGPGGTMQIGSLQPIAVSDIILGSPPPPLAAIADHDAGLLL